MSIEVVKITRPLDLGEYDEAFRGQVLFVWVNPTEEVRKMRQDLLREYRVFMQNAVSAATPSPKNDGWGAFARLLLRKKVDGADDLVQKNQAWLLNVLNQNPDSACSLDDLSRLQKADQVLYEWIVRRAVEMIEQHQVEKKSPLKKPLKP
jgi:hypothetical protein